MKIACMQPYFLPYIGYWQLINAVEKFVILDDVQYIKRGWINRNKVSVNEKDQWITIPLENANRNKLINEIEICSPNNWVPKLKRTIEYHFNKSPNFEGGYKLLNKIINFNGNDLTTFLVSSIKSICKELNIKTEFYRSSEIKVPKNAISQQRIIYICKQFNASEYINLSGGRELYEHEKFNCNKIDLNFIKSNSYFKFSSMIELMLLFDFENIKNELENYRNIT
jgi:hypothetical protein